MPSCSSCCGPRRHDDRPASSTAWVLRRAGGRRLRVHREHPLLRRRAYAGETHWAWGSGGLGAATTLFVVRRRLQPVRPPALRLGHRHRRGHRRRRAHGAGCASLAPAGRVRRRGRRCTRPGTAQAFLADGPLLPADLRAAPWSPPSSPPLGRGRSGFRQSGSAAMLTRALTDLAPAAACLGRARAALAGAARPAVAPPGAPLRRDLRRPRWPSGPLREYQRQAVELAVLHDHVMRGPPGRRGREAATPASAAPTWPTGSGCCAPT